MSYEVITTGTLINLIPKDDCDVHSEETDWSVRDLVTSKCTCGARVNFENGHWVVTHSSFDGREGLEWAAEILQPK